MVSFSAASRSSSPIAAVVAIPACNEALRIEACLAALATQRDSCGAPVPEGSFEVLVFVNNSADATAAVAAAFAETAPHPIRVVEARLPPEEANAGRARKAAMDLAAERLEAGGCRHGVILTTDADSVVAPTWLAATLVEFTPAVACVAGYIDALPAEIMRLGLRFVQRGRLEDRYLRLMAEIYALCDPRPHDPWPNHRVSSGASLAVTLQAYRAVGGLPAVALGEDAALTRKLEAAGFGVRHSMAVSVATSCRFDGRATGGAADTMRLRHAVEDAPCDDDVEPALRVLWRALFRGALRRAQAAGTLEQSVWVRRIGGHLPAWTREVQDFGAAFGPLWDHLEASHPILARRQTLLPRDLPHEIERAERLLVGLRRRHLRARDSAPIDRPLRRPSPVPAIA